MSVPARYPRRARNHVAENFDRSVAPDTRSTLVSHSTGGVWHVETAPSGLIFRRT